ncbi:MAG: arginine--tRNA ligase, partial [Proteobacteria bacterium]|nr:arginine--tRNA ligase [Pseudomonadota bacterium]
MKDLVAALVKRALDQCLADGVISPGEVPAVVIERPAHPEHGDWATNLAMVLAGPARMNPRRIADLLTERLADPVFAAVEVAGPGFINFRLAAQAFQESLRDALRQGENYGRSAAGRGQKVQVEFVSANPTGPLHVGHGRGAAVGDAVANLLAFTGHEVEREYYINDAGNQIKTLGESVMSRLSEDVSTGTPRSDGIFSTDQVLSGEDFWESHYRGDYIREIAHRYAAENRSTVADLINDKQLPAKLADFAGGLILGGIKEHLKSFGIAFDKWFSEKELFDSGAVDRAMGILRDKGLVYEKDGATWFKATELGDEK